MSSLPIHTAETVPQPRESSKEPRRLSGACQAIVQHKEHSDAHSN